MRITLFDGSTTVVILGAHRPLYDAITKAYVTSGTVTGVLKDSAGAQIGAGITFSYVAGTTGEWQGQVAHDHGGLALNQRGKMEITADAGGAPRTLFEIDWLVARYQGEA